MGVIRWLDRIDPRTWDAAVERVAREGEALLEIGAAREFLLAFGREPARSFPIRSRMPRTSQSVPRS